MTQLRQVLVVARHPELDGVIFRASVHDAPHGIGDLRQQLQVPLGNTLGPKAPSTDAFTGREADTVATLTLSNSFNMTTQGQTILLDRPDSP